MSNVVVGKIPYNVIMRSNLLRRDNPPYEVYTPQHLLYNLKRARFLRCPLGFFCREGFCNDYILQIEIFLKRYCIFPRFLLY